ncbi:MAG TPA: hypothetical protein VHL52_15445 [Acidimicrobiia bacterium]|nr:hypothetical protein [Acidimicrobiia bacterium]
MALTALLGRIRDNLRATLDDIDAIFEAVDGAGFWDEEISR